MGTSVACVYATIYYSQHEELAILNPERRNELGIMLYRRFIDDALTVLLSGEHPERYQQLLLDLPTTLKPAERRDKTSDEAHKGSFTLNITRDRSNASRYKICFANSVQDLSVILLTRREHQQG
jgi:hypothetical protein